MIALEVETAFLAVSPAMLKTIGAVILASIAIALLQRFRHEVDA